MKRDACVRELTDGCASLRSPINRYGHHCQGLQDLTDDPDKMLADRVLQIGPDNWEDMISSHPDPTGTITVSKDPHHVPSVHGFLTTLQDDRVQRHHHKSRRRQHCHRRCGGRPWPWRVP